MALTESTMVKLGSAAPYFDLPDTNGENIAIDKLQEKLRMIIIIKNTNKTVKIY